MALIHPDVSGRPGWAAAPWGILTTCLCILSYMLQFLGASELAPRQSFPFLKHLLIINDLSLTTSLQGRSVAKHQEHRWRNNKRKMLNAVVYIVIVLGALLCPTFCTPWTVAHQAPLSTGFSRQQYWSGLPFSSPVKNNNSSSISEECVMGWIIPPKSYITVLTSTTYEPYLLSLCFTIRSLQM